MKRRQFVALTALTALTSSGLAQAQKLQAVTVSEDSPLLLNFNENSLGMSPKALQAATDSLAGAFRYPDAARATLIEAIGRYFGVAKESVTLGNGSSEVIQATIHALAHKALSEGKTVQLVVPDPTFNYAEIYAEAIGVSVVKVPLKAEDLSIDVVAMQKVVSAFEGISICYICNPNNPTATITPKQMLDDWIEAKSPMTYFILDEAYADYVTDKDFKSGIEYVQAGNTQVVVTRTFSKLHAMAGLRVGFGVAEPSTVASVEGFVSIDNTNAPAAVAAMTSLQDESFIKLSLETTALSRKIVCDALDQLNLKYLPSQANFIFHEIKGDHAQYKQRMAEAHVMVGREFMPGFNRLTLGTPDEMQAFVKVLFDFRKKGWV